MSGVSRNRLRRTQKDTGWAWVTLAVSVFSQTITGGVYFTGGILNMYMLEAFNESKSFTSVPVALMAGLHQMCGLLASMSVNRFGNRRTMFVGALLASSGLLAAGFAQNVATLIPTYGIMCGVGIALSYLPTMTIISQYFDKYRITAFSITSSGSGFGMLVFPFILNAVSEVYSWRGTLIITSGLVLQLCVCAALYRENPTDLEELSVTEKQEVLPNQLGSQLSFANLPKSTFSLHQSEQTKVFHWDLFRDVPFMCILVATFLRGLSFSIVYVHLSAFMYTRGMSVSQANQLFIVIGLGSTIIRPSIGFVANALPGNTLTFVASSSSICGALMLLVPLLSASQTAIYIFSFFFGFYGGIFDSMWGPLYDSAVGTERLSSALGLGGFIYGSAVFVGPTIAGVIFDFTQTYELNFYLAGGLSFLASFTTVVSQAGRRKEMEKSTEPADEENASITLQGDAGSPLRKQVLKKSVSSKNHSPREP